MRPVGSDMVDLTYNSSLFSDMWWCLHSPGNSFWLLVEIQTVIGTGLSLMETRWGVSAPANWAEILGTVLILAGNKVLIKNCSLALPCTLS